MFVLLAGEQVTGETYGWMAVKYMVVEVTVSWVCLLRSEYICVALQQLEGFVVGAGEITVLDLSMICYVPIHRTYYAMVEMIGEEMKDVLGRT